MGCIFCLLILSVVTRISFANSLMKDKLIWASHKDTSSSQLKVEQQLKVVEYDDKYTMKVSRGQEVISSTRTQSGHYKEITLTVRAFGQLFLLDLKLNTFLFAAGYKEKFFNESGVYYNQINHAEDHCYYLGRVRDQIDSSAAVSTCHGISGYFSIDGVSYHIEPRSNPVGRRHKVYRSRSDAKTSSFPEYTLKGNEAYTNSSIPHTKINKRLKRSSSFTWPQDLDKQNKVVEVYVVNDRSQYLSNSGSLDKTIERAKDIVNSASLIYEPLDIYLVLVGLEVWTDVDRIPIATFDPYGTFTKWASYRKIYINPDTNNDIGILITNNTFLSGGLGNGLAKSICSHAQSAAYVSDIFYPVSVSGVVMAQAVAFTFGLMFDNRINPCVCPDPKGCVMNGTISVANPHVTWSECSKEVFVQSFRQGIAICLSNVPRTIYPSSAVCGNGIVETGEQCDCGTANSQQCNAMCCDSSTCQLNETATCAYGKCCDISTCEILPCGTSCRSKYGDCDLEEFCDGQSSLCPQDNYKPDGTNCVTDYTDGAYCYGGLCRSRSSQCQQLWGKGTPVSADHCYSNNVNGDSGGNCGIDWSTEKSIRCNSSNVLCGMLHCETNSTQQLAMYNFTYAISNESIVQPECKSVVFDFGLQVRDPGLVPNGAPCGIQQMCVDSICTNVANVTRSSCATSCQSNEVCNNLGTCQGIGNSSCLKPTSTTKESMTTVTFPGATGTTINQQPPSVFKLSELTTVGAAGTTPSNVMMVLAAAASVICGYLMPTT